MKRIIGKSRGDMHNERGLYRNMAAVYRTHSVLDRMAAPSGWPYHGLVYPDLLIRSFSASSSKHPDWLRYRLAGKCGMGVCRWLRWGRGGPERHADGIRYPMCDAGWLRMALDSIYVRIRSSLHLSESGLGRPACSGFAGGSSNRSVSLPLCHCDFCRDNSRIQRHSCTTYLHHDRKSRVVGWRSHWARRRSHRLECESRIALFGRPDR